MAGGSLVGFRDSAGGGVFEGDGGGHFGWGLFRLGVRERVEVEVEVAVGELHLYILLWTIVTPNEYGIQVVSGVHGMQCIYKSSWCFGLLFRASRQRWILHRRGAYIYPIR